MTKRQFMLSFILVQLLFLSLSSSQLLAKTVCICQYGVEPAWQSAIIKQGCYVFLNQYVCDSKTVIPQTDESTDYTNQVKPFDTLLVGYVGHGMSAYKVISEIERIFSQVILQPNVAAGYINTGCNSFVELEPIHEAIKGLKYGRGSILIAEGSQTATIGLWEKFYKENGAVYSRLISTSDSVIYPYCNYIIGTTCTNILHNKDRVTCQDHLRSKKILTCQKVKNPNGQTTNTSDDGFYFEPAYVYQWQLK